MLPHAAQLRCARLVTATVFGVSGHATMNILVAQHQDNNLQTQPKFACSLSRHGVCRGCEDS